MVANSLAVAAGVRASSGREGPPMERTILARREYPFCWPCRELSRQHTPESFHRRSRLGEKYSAVQPHLASFRRHFAAAKLQNWNVGPHLQAWPWWLRLKKRSGPVPAGKWRQSMRHKSSQNMREQAMSIFGKIMGAIFGHSAAAASAGGAAAPAGGSSTSTAGSSAPAAAPAQSVDVAPILDKAVAAKHEKLEWRTSIVDLMKALDIDSSLAARKELAKELGYTGDTNDSASMNVWLHKQVMAKLAANGGKLPPEIKH